MLAQLRIDTQMNSQTSVGYRVQRREDAYTAAIDRQTNARIDSCRVSGAVYGRCKLSYALTDRHLHPQTAVGYRVRWAGDACTAMHK